MKLLIATVLVAGILGAGTVNMVSQPAPKAASLKVSAPSSSQELGVQSVQGGEDNTDRTIQPAASDYSGRAYIQAQPDDPEVQPALGYQALRWNMQ